MLFIFKATSLSLHVALSSGLSIGVFLIAKSDTSLLIRYHVFVCACLLPSPCFNNFELKQITHARTLVNLLIQLRNATF